MSFSVRSRKLSEKTDDPFVVNSQELIDKKLEKDGLYKKESGWSALLNDKVRVGALTTLSYYLRTMRLGYPSFAIASELEMTRQVNWYMSGKFFIGQFPPLVGIVYSSLARLVGYYGSEELHYAQQPFYEFPLVALRRISALLGAALIPLSYYTMRHLGHSRSAATMAAGLIMLENGLVTQSRFATPDIFVLFFGALATYSWTVMHKYSQESKNLWNTNSLTWQVATGVSLGCALSSKWTGGLAVPIVWVSVAGELWNRVCERRNKVKDTLKRLSLYGCTMLLLPLFVYYIIFSFHFSLVPNSGDHDLLVSSKLKYSLVGNRVESSQPNIAYGSQIVLRHDGTVGGFLHSHEKRFSGGSTQQEVTLYPHDDINNIWTVHRADHIYNGTGPVEFVRNTDQIRLEHFATTRKLHSHDHRPQLTNRKEHNEVTAYGDKYVLDSHDYWTVQIIEDNPLLPSKNENITWKALGQKFRLMHVRGCVLVSRNVFHPPENQQEVSCMAGAASHVFTWTVESAYHEKLDKITPIKHDKMSNFEKTQEVHKLMWKYPFFVHNRVQPSSVSSGAINLQAARDETANRWFFKRIGLKLWSNLSGFSGHLVLNSIVQRLTILSMVVFPGFLAVNAFLSKRQIKLPQYLSWLNSTGLDVIVNDFYTKSILFFYPAVLIYLGLLRFLPSHTLSMSDILGTMYYGSGLIAVTFEACTSRLPTMWRRSLIYGTLVLALFKFSGLSHLAYGGEMWYRRDCESSGIDIDCIKFPPHPAELAEMKQNSGDTANSTQTTIYVELPGTSQPYRYFHGQEVEADAHVAALKHSAFLKEAYAAMGPLRYHRVLPTPAISPEDAARTAQDVTDRAAIRKIEDDRKKEEEEKLKAEQEKVEAEKAAKEEKTPEEEEALNDLKQTPDDGKKVKAIKKAANKLKKNKQNKKAIVKEDVAAAA